MGFMFYSPSPEFLLLAAGMKGKVNRAEAR
jgi:hypothetical protein